MKRVLLALLCIAGMVLLGCKHDPDPIGKWKLLPDASNNAQLNEYYKVTNFTYKLDIQKGGRFTMEAYGQTGSGEWTMALDTIRLSLTDGYNAIPGQSAPMNFVLSEDEKTLTWTDPGRTVEIKLVRDQ